MSALSVNGPEGVAVTVTLAEPLIDGLLATAAMTEWLGVPVDGAVYNPLAETVAPPAAPPIDHENAGCAVIG